mgnify:CR=1 FL=1
MIISESYRYSVLGDVANYWQLFYGYQGLLFFSESLIIARTGQYINEVIWE